MSARPGSSRLKACLIGLALLGAAGAVLAQTTDDNASALETEAPADLAGENQQTGEDPLVELPRTLEEAREALEEVEASIAVTDERAGELRTEIDELEGDRGRQNAALIAAAQRVELAEIEIDDVEGRLDQLIIEELDVRGRLDGTDAEIANVLAALARVSRNPPPALIVNPTDALGSARGALLMSAILPQLQGRAETVSADLAELMQIKDRALAEEELLRANFSVLEEEQLRIATLIAARREGMQGMSAQLDEQERAALALVDRADDLKELISQLQERAEAFDVAPGSDQVPRLSDDTIQMALADTERTEPAIPFEAARGWLRLPVSGEPVLDYGANDGLGGISRGVAIASAANAEVVAPADGWVLYKGDYLNYGQIVILNTGRNYTLLLAGMETITVESGDFVRMGEPLGTMGSRTIGRTATTGADANDTPSLYIELRRDSEPIDPTTWWADEAETT
ncbi:membrane protein [Devosia pacifica]|uniref:Membrane protein n=1 Tax=Devosia pacifica TaxID=1335967 RepID=A0A918S5Q3_9HYPH|nr:peptidoglycan DD-metalloendopeptidase family protein [Devosia pacifica]GHA24796.1 membrane protein [Devosia pacifica]